MLYQWKISLDFIRTNKILFIRWKHWLFCLCCLCLYCRPIEKSYTNKTPINQNLYEIPIWIDKSFTETDKIMIQKALENWNYALNGNIRLKIVSEDFDMQISDLIEQRTKGGWLIMKVDGKGIKRSEFIPDWESGYWSLGFVDMVGGHHLYLVRDRMKDNQVYGVVLHEMGHLLGARHLKEDGLMSPHYDMRGFGCIDEGTAVQIAKSLRIDFRTMNYCL
jgi:hypothetical protein